MKKLLLFAVVISGLALTSCAKKVDCVCEYSAGGLTVETPPVEHKGSCDDFEPEGITVDFDCHEH